MEAVGHWTSFARSYDPSQFNVSAVQKWDTAQSGRFVLQLGSSGQSTGSFMEQRNPEYESRCLFWNEVGSDIRL